MVHTEGSVTLLVSEKTWEKTRSMVEELRVMMESDSLDRKNLELERIRGFLIYVSRTYRWMVPYLKGLHLTIDSWREDRDEEGYRRKRPTPPREGGDWSWDWLSNMWYDLDMEPPQDKIVGHKEALGAVVGVPRLREDVRALGSLTVDPSPPQVNARPTRQVDVLYMMGDASGKGFGTAVWDNGSLYWESGHFTQDYSDESSNFREAANLVFRLEDMESEGKLEGAEVFVFMDNSVFEGTFY